MKPFTFLVATLTVAVLLSAAAAADDHPAPDPTKWIGLLPRDPHVLELTQFAVKTYNSQNPKIQVQLDHVDRAQKQTVSDGTTYYQIYLTTVSSGTYLTSLYEDAANVKHFISFFQQD